MRPIALSLVLALAAGPAAAGEFSEANAQFAVDLYRKLPARGSVFFSPYSISSAFGMVYAGAAGATAAELARALRFGADPDAVHRGFQEVNEDLEAWGKSGAVKLSVANALWGEKTYKFRKEYLDLCARRYGGGLMSMDFRRAHAAARAEINAWVAARTGGLIKDLLPASAVGADSKLVLTNAVYFKGDWTEAFDAENTRPAPFHKADGTAERVPLMAATRNWRYAELEGFQALELPYKGERLGMLVLLPSSPQGLPKLSAALSGKTLAAWAGSLRERKVRVRFPKFKLETELGLGPALESLGAKLAFDAARADFSPMTGKSELFVSAAIHKAFLAVDETGTEAAAATAVAMAPGAAAVSPPVPEFRADRPFLFFIRDVRGNVLFMGRYAGPR